MIYRVFDGIKFLFFRRFNKLTVNRSDTDVSVKDICEYLNKLDVKSCKNLKQLTNPGNRKWVHGLIIMSDGSTILNRYNINSKYHETKGRASTIEQLSEIVRTK